MEEHHGPKDLPFLKQSVGNLETLVQKWAEHLRTMIKENAKDLEMNYKLSDSPEMDINLTYPAAGWRRQQKRWFDATLGVETLEIQPSSGAGKYTIQKQLDEDHLLVIWINSIGAEAGTALLASFVSGLIEAWIRLTPLGDAKQYLKYCVLFLNESLLEKDISLKFVQTSLFIFKKKSKKVTALAMGSESLLRWNKHEGLRKTSLPKNYPLGIISNDILQKELNTADLIIKKGDSFFIINKEILESPGINTEEEPLIYLLDAIINRDRIVLSVDEKDPRRWFFDFDKRPINVTPLETIGLAILCWKARRQPENPDPGEVRDFFIPYLLMEPMNEMLSAEGIPLFEQEQWDKSIANNSALCLPWKDVKPFTALRISWHEEEELEEI